MKKLTSLITACLLIGFGAVYAGQGPGGSSAETVAPMPQLMLQNMYGKPDLAGDGINNATQVEDPADIGRSGEGNLEAPEPLPVEGSAGIQEAK
jgi:hypothetical protein